MQLDFQRQWGIKIYVVMTDICKSYCLTKRKGSLDHGAVVR
jgi:hypothetical protein